MAHANRYEDFNVQNVIADQLVAQGFFEIMNNSLTTAQYETLSEDIQPAQRGDIAQST